MATRAGGKPGKVDSMKLGEECLGMGWGDLWPAQQPLGTGHGIW